MIPLWAENDRSGPGANRAASNATDAAIISRELSVSPAITSRRRWAYRMLRACPEPPPTYGSPEWLALPEGSAAKVGAVVRAAECWAADGDQLEARLRLELDLARQAAKAAEDADWIARRDAHREDWTGNGFRQDPRIAAEIDAEWAEWMRGESA